MPTRERKIKVAGQRLRTSLNNGMAPPALLDALDMLEAAALRHDGPLPGEWVVMSNDPDSMNVESGVYVRADTEEEAAAVAISALHAESRENYIPAAVYVMPRVDGAYYRARYAAERVPEEFQCCGGMPCIDALGTFDEHTAPCPNNHHDDEETSDSDSGGGEDQGSLPGQPDEPF